MSVHRRRLVLEGRQLVAAVLVRDDRATRARVLSAWRPGTSVRRCAGGLLLRFEAPRELDCDAVFGAPLLEREGRLVGAPCTQAELEAVSRGAVVLGVGGALRAFAPGPDEVDVSEWLECEPAEVVEALRPQLPVAPLAPALAPRPIALRPDPKTLPPEASRALSEALRAPGAPTGQPFWRRAFASMLRWWRARRPARPALPPGAEAPRPGVGARAEQWLNRQLDRTPVGRWLDDLNRKYVDRLLAMFDREALDDALKHAPPLSRKTAEPGAPASRAPFAARRSLELNLGPRPRDAGPGAVMQPGLYETLRARYRAAAEKLEGEGRIDEAAFVLADLLDAPQEAVDLLERHGRFEKAARLAEARSLAADAVVRLWVLAQDLERAVLVARRHRAFAGAITRLERGNLAQARTLRVQWGEWLASSGDFAGAVQAVAPIPEARALMLRWVDLGIEAGGVAAAPLLVKRLELDPPGAAPHFERAVQLLSDRSDEQSTHRAALGEALAAATEPSALELRRPLVRLATRAMIRDEAAFGVTRPGVVGRLLALDDGPLRADLPSYAPGVRPLKPLPTRFERDGSALVPHDALPMRNGALLVALGENGLALVNHHGRVSWRSDVPAFSLVASDEGPHVLALAPREDVVTVSRVSVATKTAARWADLPRGAWSDSFRDGTWFVQQGQRVVGFDVLGERQTALWELPGAGFVVEALAASGAHVTALGRGLDVVRQSWRLPSFEQHLAGPVMPAVGVERVCVAAGGEFLVIARGANQELRAWTPATTPNQPPVSQPLPGQLAGEPSCRQPWYAVPTRWRQETPDQLDVLLRPGTHSFGFGHATRAHTRIVREVLVICADNGHVVTFDLQAQRLLRDVTVRP